MNVARQADSNLVIKATLGGLVHDLGKPWSQAQGRPPEASRFECGTPAQHRSVESCPSCRKYRYAHGPLAATLLRDQLPGFSFLQHLALCHHAGPAEVNAAGPAMRYVILGDHLSAGERDELFDSNSPSSPTPALLNPFATTGLFVEPEGLHRSDALLHTTADVAAARQALAHVVKLQRQALSCAGQYAGGDESALVDHLCGAVEATASLAPSAFWRSVADISLAAHLQFAAAFAGALAAGGVPEDFDAEGQADQAVATLVMGDLSGIQSFIHRVASKRAARSLRARSFYLTVLSTVVARFIAERLGVTSANVLSSVGGNFLVLAPHDSEERLDELTAEIDRALAETHGAALSISLAASPLSPQDTRRFPEVLRSLSRTLRDRKARRAERTALTIGLFEPKGDGGPLKACRSCGDDASAGVIEGDDRVCRFCHSLEALGRGLPKSRYLTIASAEPGGATGWQQVARRLGYELSLHQGPPQAPVHGAIYALSPKALADLPCARLLSTGRHVPVQQDGAPLDFEEVAKQAEGRELLAVLKADVDDLGKTFADHFKRGGASTQSPSRTTTFMRFLSLFFEGRVNELAETEFPNVYVVFAGGDDLAVVGPWNEVLEFIRQVRQEFAAWTGGNDTFHFSVGISFGDANRPVIAALQEAERLLGRAKDRPGKNAVALLDDRVLAWEHFEETMQWFDELQRLIAGAAGDGVARSLVQRLKRLDVLTAPQNGKVVYGPELWRAYYALRRFAERHARTSTQLNAMYERALEKYGGLKLAIAARLAEFATARGD